MSYHMLELKAETKLVRDSLHKPSNRFVHCKKKKKKCRQYVKMVMKVIAISFCWICSLETNPGQWI